MSKDLIMVFTRNPELGKVKTRLAKTIGKANALKVYEYLLHHTHDILLQLDIDKAVYYSVTIRENDMWSSHHFQKHQQQGSDLGLRMLDAFKSAFKKNYNKVIIIGSDLLDLRAKHIKDALKALDTHDITIGPALDGGYYLIGMTNLYSNIFQNKNWGTDTVFKATMQDLENHDVHLLDELNDIDTFADFKVYPELKQLIT
ncbi:MAG: glycosyltransferase [Flavobacteriaceae bacterium]|nr:glycosyltransferase [Flavobacteriaceae bacterium]